jgi:dolichol-phosphate mannosyltransferase
MESKELSLIIPAYKEAENLKIILPRINAVLRSLNINSEVLVVDTREPMDDARAVCEANQTAYYNREGANNYYGDAIKTAIKKADGKYILFMDADGSHDPEFIKNLYANKQGYDIVAASRYVAGGDNDNGKLSIFMSKMVNKIYSLVLDIKCQDISNSFKLYKATDLKALNLQCDNFDIIEEMMYKIKKKNGALNVKELPFLFKKRMFGNTKRNLLVFMMSYMRTLIKLRFGK